MAGRKNAGTAVEYVGVTRAYGSTRALDGLDLRIEPGELIALLGPSGCGKTTALRILAGFDQPSTGKVLIDGSDVTRVPANKRDMGMVFQSYSLFPTMTAIDNVGFGLRLRREPAAARRARAAELLELVGLSEHLTKYPHQMSGGQQQRVALARALAVRPRVLLLDEPLSALDAKVREQLREEIRRLQLELGVTTVFVTHDQEEALSMADRVGVMRSGRLEQCDTPAVLYQRPATPFVAEFVGTTNRIPAVVVGRDQVRVGAQTMAVLGGASVPAGTDVTVLVRPESVVVTPSADGDSVIEVTTFRGATTRLRLIRADGSVLFSDVSSHRPDLGAGARVAVSLADHPVLVSDRAAGDPVPEELVPVH